MLKLNYPQLISEYIALGYKASFDERLSRIRTLLLDPDYSDLVKAECLLIQNHQARLNDVRGEWVYARIAIEILAKDRTWEKNPSLFPTFADLLDYIKKLIGHVNYIGDLTCYDVAVNLTCIFTSAKPKLIYLYGNGPYSSACAIVEKKTLTVRVVDHSFFGNVFITLDAEYTEELLCVFGPYFKDPTTALKPHNGRFFRRGLLAHQILEENWGKPAITDPRQLQSVFNK